MSLPMLPYYRSDSPISARIRSRIHYYKIKFAFHTTPRETRNCQIIKCGQCLNYKPKSDFYHNHGYCKQCFRSNNKQYRAKCRIKALKIISSELKCVRCGCNDIRFLEINHKNGGGSKEQKSLNYRYFIYAIINGKRKTDDLELLCKPCNHIHYLEMKYGEKIPLRVVWEKPIEVMCR